MADPATQVDCTDCATFTKCITKIDERTLEEVEELDLVMPLYNLLG